MISEEAQRLVFYAQLWHDLVVGVLDLWGPIGVGRYGSTADELMTGLSLALSKGDISQRVVRYDDDRWVVVSPGRRALSRGKPRKAARECWVDELATLHRAAARLEAIGMELLAHDEEEGAWWLGVSGSLVQALAEYSCGLGVEAEAEADAVAGLVGAAMLEQLELWEHVVVKRPHPCSAVLGSLVSGEAALSAGDPLSGLVVLPVPSGVADGARAWSREHSMEPLSVLVICYPLSSWIHRYLPCVVTHHERYRGSGRAIGEWYSGRVVGSEMWCALVPRSAVADVAAAVARLIREDLEARICGPAHDRMAWGALVMSLDEVAP